MTPLHPHVEKIKPRLKVGTILLARKDSTYVGHCNRGLEITSPARTMLAVMDGAGTCAEISQALGIPLEDIENLLRDLDAAGLIDTEPAKISVHTRFHSANAHRASHDSDDHNDGAVQQLRAKLAPELTLATWLPHVRDGGITTLSRRRNWQVMIFGDSRIATLVYGILLSSGISQTSVQSPNDHRQISERDLCAGFIHPGDIGYSYAARTQELSRELSLFPTTKALEGEDLKQFVIAVGNTPADQVQEWMSKGIAHLIVDVPDGGALSIGPIVIPGQSPCARCISLALDDQNPKWGEISMQKILNPVNEVPVSVAHCVSGIVALEALRYIDEGQSILIGAKVRLDYREPTLQKAQTFTRHPACGCNW